MLGLRVDLYFRNPAFLQNTATHFMRQHITTWSFGSVTGCFSCIKLVDHSWESGDLCPPAESNRFKDSHCSGGGFYFGGGFFSEQWHLPFQVAFKVVSILCSGFRIFLCLFPAAPTLDGTFAIVLALICTEVGSPAGRAEVPPSLGGLTTLLSRVGDIFALLFWGCTDAARGFLQIAPKGRRGRKCKNIWRLVLITYTSIEAFKPFLYQSKKKIHIHKKQMWLRTY